MFLVASQVALAWCVTDAELSSRAKTNLACSRGGFSNVTGLASQRQDGIGCARGTKTETWSMTIGARNARPARPDNSACVGLANCATIAIASRQMMNHRNRLRPSPCGDSQFLPGCCVRRRFGRLIHEAR